MRRGIKERLSGDSKKRESEDVEGPMADVSYEIN